MKLNDAKAYGVTLAKMAVVSASDLAVQNAHGHGRQRMAAVHELMMKQGRGH